MKKLSATILFSILCIQFLSAQQWDERTNSHDSNDWSIGIGVNGVNDSGESFKEIFNVSDYWNFGTPIYVNAEYYINNKFSIGATVSFNKYKEGKVVDHDIILKDHEASYIAFDLAGKFSFRELLKSKAIEPFVFIGAGYTNIGDHESVIEGVIPAEGRMTLNAGLGCNYWFSPNWGLGVNALGKYGLGEGVTNQSQVSLGILYAIFKQRKN